MLLHALDGLDDVLLPHLEREEAQTMPVAAAALTDAEWQAWAREYHISPKSLAELGEEGHWLLDDLDQDRAELVRAQVPPVARFVLLHGFARRYRRHAAERWGAEGPGGLDPAVITAGATE